MVALQAQLEELQVALRDAQQPARVTTATPLTANAIMAQAPGVGEGFVITTLTTKHPPQSVRRLQNLRSIVTRLCYKTTTLPCRHTCRAHPSRRVSGPRSYLSVGAIQT